MHADSGDRAPAEHSARIRSAHARRLALQSARDEAHTYKIRACTETRYSIRQRQPYTLPGKSSKRFVFCQAGLCPGAADENNRCPRVAAAMVKQGKFFSFQVLLKGRGPLWAAPHLPVMVKIPGKFNYEALQGSNISVFRYVIIKS